MTKSGEFRAMDQAVKEPVKTVVPPAKGIQVR